MVNGSSSVPPTNNETCGEMDADLRSEGAVRFDVKIGGRVWFGPGGRSTAWAWMWRKMNASSGNVTFASRHYDDNRKSVLFGLVRGSARFKWICKFFLGGLVEVI